jgi:hypothetical protein
MLDQNDMQTKIALFVLTVTSSMAEVDTFDEAFNKRSPQPTLNGCEARVGAPAPGREVPALPPGSAQA